MNRPLFSLTAKALFADMKKLTASTVATALDKTIAAAAKRSAELKL